jgi:uncharacterized Zn-finger protein
VNGNTANILADYLVLASMEPSTELDPKRPDLLDIGASWSSRRAYRKKLGSVGQIELRQMRSYPKFHNEIGVPIVRVGCREFECIGAIPPQDHPHIYLNMGDASGIVCPYCSTLFHFDPSLGAHEADPADCAYGDMD